MGPDLAQGARHQLGVDASAAGQQRGAGRTSGAWPRLTTWGHWWGQAPPATAIAPCCASANLPAAIILCLPSAGRCTSKCACALHAVSAVSPTAQQQPAPEHSFPEAASSQSPQDSQQQQLPGLTQYTISDAHDEQPHPMQQQQAPQASAAADGLRGLQQAEGSAGEGHLHLPEVNPEAHTPPTQFQEDRQQEAGLRPAGAGPEAAEVQAAALTSRDTVARAVSMEASSSDRPSQLPAGVLPVGSAASLTSNMSKEPSSHKLSALEARHAAGRHAWSPLLCACE